MLFKPVFKILSQSRTLVVWLPRKQSTSGEAVHYTAIGQSIRLSDAVKAEFSRTVIGRLWLVGKLFGDPVKFGFVV